MKKLFLIFSLAIMSVNVYAKNRSKVLESVNKDMIINKRIKRIEGIQKVILGESNNLIMLSIKKDIKNINIDIFDESGKRIIDESMVDGLSMLERGGVSEITLNSFESEGKLFLEFYNLEIDQEITIEITLEGEDIDDLEDIIEIEYMEWHRKLCLFLIFRVRGYKK